MGYFARGGIIESSKDVRFLNYGELVIQKPNPVVAFFRALSETHKQIIEFEKWLKSYKKIIKAMENQTQIKKIEQKIEELKAEVEKLKEENKYFDLSKLKISEHSSTPFINGAGAGFLNNCFFEIRSDYAYKNKGFFLNSSYNWEIVRDETAAIILLPTKK